MLYIETDGTIRLTRGDTARLNVQITNQIGEDEYTIDANDTLTFSVKKSVSESEYVLQKTIVGSGTFHIEPHDTSELAYGKYKYDVQLTTAGGDVYTIIEPSTFELLKEVTW